MVYCHKAVVHMQSVRPTYHLATLMFSFTVHFTPSPGELEGPKLIICTCADYRAHSVKAKNNNNFYYEGKKVE
jgi:hypothetical protein